MISTNTVSDKAEDDIEIGAGHDAQVADAGGTGGARQQVERHDVQRR